VGDWQVIGGDVLETLEGELLDELGPFDALFGDPPYGFKFMGKAWDRGVPSSKVYRTAMRHLRPGANVLQFGGPRTSHRLTCSIEDAGFEIRDRLYCWLYGSGWAKPANVSKYIDKRLGKERAVIGNIGGQVTAPGSPQAARFDGYHANLAPACEPAILARKPLDGTLADNALTHGLAGLNVDGCRVEANGRPAIVHAGHTIHTSHAASAKNGSRAVGTTNQGRWPSNVILTCDEAICGPGDPREIEHRPGCHVFELDGQSGVRQSGGHVRANSHGKQGKNAYGTSATSWQSTGFSDNDTGASKFFYCAKVSKSERGLSAHPCMKPIALCTYLARLLLPPPMSDGQPRRILVPYSGSGSEMIGALAAGWDVVVGIEWDASAQNPGKRPDYWVDVAKHRIREWEGTLRGEHVKADVVAGKAQQLGLF
jgi:site-specific DNA-methyltransferase (adenine-specific)